MQTWPALKKSPNIDWDIAFYKLAYLEIIFADFPPNSNVTLLRFYWWEFFIISNPTSVEPVKATLSIPGCLAK